MTVSKVIFKLFVVSNNEHRHEDLHIEVLKVTNNLDKDISDLLRKKHGQGWSVKNIEQLCIYEEQSQNVKAVTGQDKE